MGQGGQASAPAAKRYVSSQEKGMMKKKRPAVPSLLKTQVLKEYHHLCAICGGASPQVHHIDGDPGHNDIHNLIPLCPNCHMRDQHDPTAPLEQGIVRLFRLHKDPAILTPEFYPIFKRMRFLTTARSDDYNPDELERSWKDLLKFVSMLEMGKYYSTRLEELLHFPSWFIAEEAHLAQVKMDRIAIVDSFPEIRPKIEGLVVEMLRYQRWTYDHKKS